MCGYEMGMSGLREVDTNASTPPSKKSGKSNDDERPYIDKGKLDLSRKGYDRLSLRYKDAYGEVTLLDLSHNNFKFINGLNLFTRCSGLQASHNSLERLSSFLSLRNVLRVLDVSNNAIMNPEHLASLTALVTLNASHNRITELPLLDRLIHLTRLDLSSNRFESLPALSRVSTLEVLNLNGNRIASLENCSRQLPPNIKSLDIGNNSIVDLRQAEYLSCLRSLDSLTWSGNPCVGSSSRTFTYRPFLYSCCFETLRVVDGFALHEAEIIKGELLCTMSKTRRTQTHAELCALLAKECPIDVDLSDLSSLSSFDGRLLKVVEKRREYMKATTVEDGSSLSFAEHSQRQSLITSGPQMVLFKPNSHSHMQSREKATEEDVLKVGGNSPSESHSPHAFSSSSPPSASSVTSSSTFVLSHQESITESISVAKVVTQANVSKVRWPRGATIAKRSAIRPNQRLLGRRSPHIMTDPSTRNCNSTTNGTRLLCIFDRTENGAAKLRGKTYVEKKATKLTETCCNVEWKFPCKGTITSRSDRERASKVRTSALHHYSESHIDAAVRIQAWWRGLRARRIWRVPLLEARLKRYALLHRQMDERLQTLGSQCEQLSQIVEQQSEWMRDISDFVVSSEEKMESCLGEFSESLRRCLPVPSELQFARNSPTRITVQWQDVILPYKSYALYVDGQKCGIVRANRMKAQIRDLDPNKESIIEVQCICGEAKGDKSQPLVVPPISERASMEHKPTALGETLVGEPTSKESSCKEITNKKTILAESNKETQLNEP